MRLPKARALLHPRHIARLASAGASFAVVGIMVVAFAATSFRSPAASGTKAGLSSHHHPLDRPHQAAKKKAAAPAPAPTPAAKPAAPVPHPSAPPANPPAAAAATAVAQSAASPGTGPSNLSPTPAPSASSGTGSSGSASTPASPATTSYPAATISYTSSNWAGYLATGGGYTGLSGKWVAPSPDSSGPASASDSTWIGIGGVSTNDLIQVGTENAFSSHGKLSTSAFYELLPDYPVYITTVFVHPGDSITASLSQAGSGQWNILLTDLTDGQSFSTTVSYASSLSSAEWIEEDPSYSDGSLVPFDNFGTATFSAASMTANGTTTNLASGNADAIMMIDSSNHPVATPSGLDASGASFQVTRNL